MLASRGVVLLALGIVGVVLVPIIMGELNQMGQLVADMVRVSHCGGIYR